MDWIQVSAIIGANAALIGAMIGLVVWAVNKLDSDVKSICTRLDGHATRIDQLYHIMIGLLKK